MRSIAPGRGLVFAQEARRSLKSAKMQHADRFERGVSGADMSNHPYLGKIVPALRYTNPKKGGHNIVRFDGYEVINGKITLIDTKTRLLEISTKKGSIFPQKEDLRRIYTAAELNPEYRVMLEFETEQAMLHARDLLRNLEIDRFIHIRARK